MTPAQPSIDRRLDLMGTHVRLLIGAPAPGGPAPADAADAVEALLRDYDRRLSRFRPDSELSALNADPRPVVPASGLLRSAVRAALGAAERTSGLVDPVVLDGMRAAGYETSWDTARRLDLREAMVAAGPTRRPASPDARERWRHITIDDEAATIARPPGLRIDTGGTGKGHAADLAAELLGGLTTWAVDCGGDLRIGGTAGLVQDIQIEEPFTGAMGEWVRVRRGAVATSGLRSRIWRTPDGRIAHHLLDPADGEPAFTGLVAATALAPTAVEAETLAKTALLSGPQAAVGVLRRHGGIVVADDGQVVRIGRLEPGPLVRLPADSQRTPTHRTGLLQVPRADSGS